MHSSDACGSKATTTSGPSVRHGATRHSPLGTRHSHNLTDSRHHSPRDCSAAEHQKHRPYQLTSPKAILACALPRSTHHGLHSTKFGEHDEPFPSRRSPWHAYFLKRSRRAVDLNSMLYRAATAALVRQTKSFDSPKRCDTNPAVSCAPVPRSRMLLSVAAPLSAPPGQRFLGARGRRSRACRARSRP